MGSIGGILGGGKGGGSYSSPPSIAEPAPDNTAEIMTSFMGMMGGMMEGVMGAMANSQALMESLQMPEMPTLPEITRTADIDWEEKQDQLQSKMSADFNVDEARRKGRSGTVLSSPLLDEEDATTTGSVLAN